MRTTCLNEFIGYSKKKKAVFVPFGTIEWHGNHLPIETDFLIAKKICEILSEKIKGYVLPPIYLGTDREIKIGVKKLIGMNWRLKKELEGNLYYLKPNIFFALVSGLVNNLIKQGFNKVYLITGHAGTKQVEILKKIENKRDGIVFLNPFQDLSIQVHHADENETSLFWVCYPEEELKSREIKIKNNDDFIKYQGYDVRNKASLKLGKKILNEIIKNLMKKIK